MVYNSKEPSFHILICLIQIWNINEGDDPMIVPKDCMQISEVENIEIEETYTKPINSAVIQFPRGTIIRKTVTRYNEQEAGEEKALNVGVSKSGVIEVTRKSSTVATTECFNIGQRIRIYLGYTTDPTIANYAKSSNLKKNIFNDEKTRSAYLDAFKLPIEQQAKNSMNIMFDGYITKVSVDTPIQIECENFATALRQITCPNKDFTKCSVNTLLCPKGTKAGENKNGLDLLKGTGLTLSESTYKLNIQVGHCKLSPEKTLADIVSEWAKFGVYTFVSEENGKPVLKCARSYFIDKQADSILEAIPQMGDPIPIKFDYNVAKNGLSMAIVYDGYIAVDAQGVSPEGGQNDQFLRVTICKNPDYDEKKGGEKYRILNESKISKKAMKRGFHVLSKASKDKKHDLRLYAKIPYFAKKIPITRDELLDEAVKYMDAYNFNGIEGSLTIFGDLHLHTGYRVQLIDNRYPGKNGIYLVESVETSFGTDGYRQTIKLPYCIKRTGTVKK